MSGRTVKPPPSNADDPGYLDSLVSDYPSRSAANLELIDWASINERPEELIEGLVISGRWTAIAGAAKSGKSTLLIHVTTCLAERGRDPFDGHTIDRVPVLYVDAEMGRSDLYERLLEHGLDPMALSTWHATDLPPKLDTQDGGRVLAEAVERCEARVVVIDGINGTVSGAEKDDSTWRAFYEHTVKPLKLGCVAVLTGDNLGKDTTLGPRGSSVKLDKADAIIQMSRNKKDNSVTLKATHRRTAAYPLERTLAMTGGDGLESISYRGDVESW